MDWTNLAAYLATTAVSAAFVVLVVLASGSSARSLFASIGWHFVFVVVAWVSVGAALAFPSLWVRSPRAFHDRHVAEESGAGVRILLKNRGKDEVSHVYLPSELRASMALRLQLRARFGLTLDFGAESPEIIRPGDPPAAYWNDLDALPAWGRSPASRGVYRQHAGDMRIIARAVCDEQQARELRKVAEVATTVVDEALLDDDLLYVREGKDVASMDLALLRGAAPLGDGSVAFSFGKFTTVVFPDAKDNPVVEALRERLAQKRESTPAAAPAFDEVQEVEEEVGSAARPKGTAR